MRENKHTSVINLFDRITEDSAKAFVQEFKQLERVSNEIEIRINSSGGSVLWGWSIVDTILNSKVKTVAVVVGVAASMASVMMASADTARMYEHASIMMHNPFFTAGEPDVVSEQLETYRQQLISLYVARWDKSKQEVIALMEGKEGQDGTWLKAPEALQMGIIDTIIPTPQKLKEQLRGVDNIINSSRKANEAMRTFSNIWGWQKEVMPELKNISDTMDDIRDRTEGKPLNPFAGISGAMESIYNKTKRKQ